MTDAPMKASLDAHADQKLAGMRDLREVLALLGSEGEGILALADTMASVLRGQFPDTPHLGRIAVAVLTSADSLRGAFMLKGTLLSSSEVSAIVGLAAEKLEAGEVQQ